MLIIEPYAYASQRIKDFLKEVFGVVDFDAVAVFTDRESGRNRTEEVTKMLSGFNFAGTVRTAGAFYHDITGNTDFNGRCKIAWIAFPT